MLTIQNSTLAFNVANNATGGGATADGGGLSVAAAVTGTPVQLISSIVSNNVAKVGVAGSGTAPDVQGNNKGFESFSLVKNTANLGLTDLGNNQNGKDPKLVADNSNNPINNGGTTNTYALTPGTVGTPNPAVDTGFNGAGLITDQRGSPRVSGAGPDIGTFESTTSAPTTNSIVVTTSADSGAVACTRPSPSPTPTRPLMRSPSLPPSRRSHWPARLKSPGR